MPKRTFIDVEMDDSIPKKEKIDFEDLDKSSLLRICITIIITVLTSFTSYFLARSGIFGELARNAINGSGKVSAVSIIILIQAAESVACIITVGQYFITKEYKYKKKIKSAVSELSSKADFDTDIQSAGVDAQTLDHFISIRDNLKTLSDENEQMKSEIKNIVSERDYYQFKMIGAQMSPGMIMRAVWKIKRVAEQRKINDISLFSDNLLSMMRGSLKASMEPVPLSNELDMIRKYLDLDYAITGKKTLYKISVMSSIVGYKVIPHLVLPVIENFLEYSKRGNCEKYEIFLEISSIATGMLITLKDNGEGLSVDYNKKLQTEISNKTIDDDADALSLSSINRRIWLCYGEDYGLNVSACENGTIVKILLPAKADALTAEA